MDADFDLDELLRDEDAHVEEADNFLAFTGAIPCKEKSIFILVVGMTGSGKSRFISSCTRKNVVVGHDLVSCTRSLAIFTVEHAGYTVYLIDTPGFNDTNRPDVDTLRGIAYYLSVSYANRVSIGGIIYLHRISDNRLAGTAARNIAMVKALSGATTYSNVAVVTTMWSITARDDALRRETQLLSNPDAFADLISGGAKSFRHYEPQRTSERSSTLGIISHLIHKSRLSPVTLLIQSEMVDEQKSLRETRAAAILLDDLDATRDELREETMQAQNAVREAEQAQDAAAMDSLDQWNEELRMRRARADEETLSLSATLRQIHVDEERRILQKLDDMERRWQEQTDAKLRELDVVQREVKTRADSERQLDRLRNEVDRLTKAVESKTKANGKVRSGLRSGLISGLASGAASGVVGAVATGLLAAGVMCIVS